jgi:hypothetical protein
VKHLTSVALVLSGAATAVQGYVLLMYAIWGRPTSPLQSVAIVGSLVQVIAGVILFWRERAILVGLMGLVLTWLFYGPAIFNTARADWSHIHFKPAGAIPSVLLIAASGLSVLFLRSRRAAEAGS